MHRTIKIQHEHQTSPSALQMLNPYVDKNYWLVLAGKKQAGCAQVCGGKKCLNFWSEIISMPRVRQNLRNKINKLHCFRPLSRDNGGVDKIQPCSSGCHSDSLDVWRSKEMRRIRIWKMFAEIQPWYFVAVLNKEEMILKNFSQLKCMLLEVLNLKCVTGPMPLTSVYPPLSRKYQHNCDWKTIFLVIQQTYSG